MGNKTQYSAVTDKGIRAELAADISALSFSDLFDIEEVQKIQDAFAETTGVASIITDPNGRPITRPSRFCTLCNDIIRKTEKGLANCYHSDAIIGRQNPDGPVVSRCLSGGLWDGGTSISVGGHHIANWLIGQVIDDSVNTEIMIDYAHEIGADEKLYREALAKVTRMSEEQFRRICNALALIAKLLSELAYENFLKEREIEESVKRRTEELRLMQTCIDKAADAIYWVEQSGRLIYVNEAACAQLRYTQQELTSLSITDIDTVLTDRYWPEFWDRIKNSGAATFQTRHIDRLGSRLNLEISSTYQEFGNRPYLFLFARDISEREMAMEEMRQNELRTKALLEISQMTTYSLEDIYMKALTSALQISGSSCGFIGLSADDGRTVTVNHWSENLYPGGCDEPVSFNREQKGIWGDTLRQRKPIIASGDVDPLCLMIVSPDREEYNHFISIPVFDGNTLTRLVGLAGKESAYTSSDVAQMALLFYDLLHIQRRKNAEKALKENWERYFFAISGSKIGIWDLDLIKDSGYFSPNVNEWIGIDNREIINYSKVFPKYVHPDDRNHRAQVWRDHMDGKAPYILEYRIISTTGTVKWMSVRGEVIRDETGRPVRMAGSVTDITEDKKAEEDRKIMEMQLNQAQKLESIGRLASGIAHEINTPIQYIGDNTRFLLDSFNDIIEILKQCRQVIAECAVNPEMAEKAKAVEQNFKHYDIPYLVEEIPTAISQSLEGIRHVAGIVMAMKEFSHPDSDDTVFIDLNRSIESTATVARNEWKYVANLELELDQALPKVSCTPGAINQVILNMIINAAHSIAEKIELGAKEKGTIKIKTSHSDGFAEIRISDTGMGIPEKYRSRIFDPFFTTKSVGKGTGQGLSIAYNVITQRHKGSISFQTGDGIGTEFLIRLPLGGDSASAAHS